MGYRLCYDGAALAALDCVHCPYGMAAQMQFTLSTLINDGCSDCVDLNTTFVLPQVAGCVWQYSGYVDICAHSTIITLSWLNDFDWALVFVGGGTHTECSPGYGMVVRYTLPEAAFDCLGSNDMILNCYNDSCGGWPAILTVAAV